MPEGLTTQASLGPRRSEEPHEPISRNGGRDGGLVGRPFLHTMGVVWRYSARTAGRTLRYGISRHQQVRSGRISLCRPIGGTVLENRPFHPVHCNRAIAQPRTRTTHPRNTLYEEEKFVKLEQNTRRKAGVLCFSVYSTAFVCEPLAVQVYAFLSPARHA